MNYLTGSGGFQSISNQLLAGAAMTHVAVELR